MGILLWSVFVGFLGILYPPFGDMYRYALDFEEYANSNLNNFLFLLSIKFDYLYSIISFSLGRLGCSSDIMRFLYNFVGTLLLSNLYLMIVSDNSELVKDRKLKIYSLFVFIPFTIGLFLFRYNFSIVLFIYGVYLVCYKRKKMVGYG